MRRQSLNDFLLVASGCVRLCRRLFEDMGRQLDTLVSALLLRDVFRFTSIADMSIRLDDLTLVHYK